MGANPLLSVGLQQTQQYMGQTMNKFSPGVTSFWGGLKFYFAVSNSYVLRKIRLLLFPFLHRDFAPMHLQNTGPASAAVEPVPPIHDLHSPDLYIPVMGFITYILIFGYIKGRSRSFTPELLIETFSSSLTLLFLQLLFIIGGNFSLGQHAFKYNYCDMIAFSGYKFVGITLILFFGMMFHEAPVFGALFGVLYYSLVCYCAACSVFCMVKSVKCFMELAKVNPSGGAAQPQGQGYGYDAYGGYGNAGGATGSGGQTLSKRAKTMLIALAVIEGLVVLYLGYVPELTDQLPSAGMLDETSIDTAFGDADIVMDS